MKVDFGRTAEDYGRYRAGFPDVLFERLAPFDLGVGGQRVLDLATGTGTLARGFALRGCQVTGIDLSAELLEQARALDRRVGVKTRYVVARAEATGIAGQSFDVITAGQCWHWFDRARVLDEASRILVEGGRLLIAYFDWIPIPGNIADATERLIERHNPDWKFGGGVGVHPQCVRDVSFAGFGDIESFSTDLYVPYSHEGWRGRIRASAGVGASLSPQGIRAFDAALQKILRANFPREPLQVLHRLFAVICRRPGAPHRPD
jgi:SAM-dependent methyltransferase